MTTCARAVVSTASEATTGRTFSTMEIFQREKILYRNYYHLKSYTRKLHLNVIPKTNVLNVIDIVKDWSFSNKINFYV